MNINRWHLEPYIFRISVMKETLNATLRLCEQLDAEFTEKEIRALIEEIKQKLDELGDTLNALFARLPD